MALTTSDCVPLVLSAGTTLRTAPTRPPTARPGKLRAHCCPSLIFKTTNPRRASRFQQTHRKLRGGGGVSSTAGTFQPAAGASGCLDCVAGSHTVAGNVLGNGTFVEVAATDCTACLPGRHSADASGAVACQVERNARHCHCRETRHCNCLHLRFYSCSSGIPQCCTAAVSHWSAAAAGVSRGVAF